MTYQIFKGTLTEYRTLHRRIQTKLGRPLRCDNCGSTDKTRYAWANISGEYSEDLDDWVRLCYSCHQLIDGNGRGKNRYVWSSITKTGFCKNGHKVDEKTIYVRPSGYKECRYCIRKRVLRYKHDK